jgi:hypothetical protein
MGHAYGLDHSRSDAPNVNVCDPTTLDYRDPWDGMSTACAFFAPDPDYGARGPGFNAWNMRGRVVNALAPDVRWLDESRVWHGPSNVFSPAFLAHDCEYEADSDGSRPLGAWEPHRSRHADRDAEGVLLLVQDA